jgi:hypothetical protein
MESCPNKAKVELRAFSSPPFLSNFLFTKLTSVLGSSENKAAVAEFLKANTYELRVQLHSVLQSVPMQDQKTCYQRVIEICPGLRNFFSIATSSGLSLAPGLLPPSQISTSSMSSSSLSNHLFQNVAQVLSQTVPKEIRDQQSFKSTLFKGAASYGPIAESLSKSTSQVASSALPTPSTSSSSSSSSSSPVAGIPLVGVAKEKCDLLLTELTKHPRANFFLKPEHLSMLPDFVKIVKTPMDLGTVRSLFDQDKLSTIENLISHVRLIFENVVLYGKTQTHYQGVLPQSEAASFLLSWFDFKMNTCIMSIAQSSLGSDLSRAAVALFESRLHE